MNTSFYSNEELEELGISSIGKNALMRIVGL